MGFTSPMAHSCFLFSVPKHNTVLLSFSLLWTFWEQTCPNPGTDPILYVPCPAAAGQLSYSHSQSWFPELQPGHSSKDLSCIVWEDRHLSNESHSHLHAPATHLSYISCTYSTLLYLLYLSLSPTCASQSLTACSIFLNLSRTSCEA